MDIAKKLRDLRTERHLKQHEIYNAIGVSRSYYSAFETGERQPSIDILEKICDFYGITLSDFFREEIETINNPPIDAEQIELLKNANVTTEQLKKALKIIQALEGS